MLRGGRVLSLNLRLGARGANGRTLGEDLSYAKVYADNIIHPLNNPLVGIRQTCVLRRMAPDGVVAG